MTPQKRPPKLSPEDRLFVENMKSERARLGLSQDALAEKVAEHGVPDFNQVALSRIEAGTRQLGLGEARAIAAALGGNVDEMVQPASEYGLYQNLRHQRTRWLNYAQANLSTAVAEVGDALERMREARDALEASDWRDALDGQAYEAAAVELRAAADYLCEERDEDPLEAIAQKLIAEYRQGHHSTGYVSPEA